VTKSSSLRRKRRDLGVYARDDAEAPSWWGRGMAHAGTGSAALFRFFEPGVRERALAYVTPGRIQVVKSTATLLVAFVKGRTRYRTVFARSGTAVHYACSCPYFEGSMEACKHLYALALQQGRALSCSRPLRRRRRFTTRPRRPAASFLLQSWYPKQRRRSTIPVLELRSRSGGRCQAERSEWGAAPFRRRRPRW
jgi:SWIM zinc finger